MFLHFCLSKRCQEEPSLLAGRAAAHQKGLCNSSSLSFYTKPPQLTEFTPSFERRFNPTSTPYSTPDKPSRSCSVLQPQHLLLVLRQGSVRPQLTAGARMPYTSFLEPGCCRITRAGGSRRTEMPVLFAEKSP